MLEEFYEAPHILRGFRESAAGPLIESLAAKLPPLGYKRDFVQRLLRGAAHLVEWSWLDVTVKGEIDEQSLDLFRAHLAVCACPRGRRDRVEDQLRGARIMIDHVLGRAIVRRDPIPTVLVAPVVEQFDEWMRLQRGLVDATRQHYLRYVNRFVGAHGDDSRGYGAGLVRAFVVQQAEGGARARAQAAANALGCPSHSDASELTPPGRAEQSSGRLPSVRLPRRAS